jgi:WD40 repeat protein
MKDGKQRPGSYQKAVKVFEGHKKEITSIATFLDGKRIATASLDKTIRIWRLEDGTEITKWVVEQQVGELVLWKTVLSVQRERSQTILMMTILMMNWIGSYGYVMLRVGGLSQSSA